MREKSSDTDAQDMHAQTRHRRGGRLPAPADRVGDPIDEVADRLRARARGADGVASEVLMAQVSLVSDKGLRRAAAKQIKAGANAERAILAAVDEFAAMFAKVGGLMAERITDLRDLGTRVFAQLRGLPEPGISMPTEPSVLLADDLAPADTATLDPSLVVAIVTRLGGPTSHTAIIARQLGLPCIVAADIAGIEAGTVVLVDGAAGEVVIDPDPQQARERIEADRRTREAAAAWRGPGQTSDGHDVAILANVQDGSGAASAAQGQAEGIGLFRTELAFLGNETEPTVDEQAEAYAAVLTPFAGRKVVIRTLDAGSDKPMKFANLTHEDNPALGMRGLRLSVGNPGLLTHQLDAIAKAAKQTGESPWVMAPMVATADEARRFAEQVRERGLTPGVMIEIPAAAIEAKRILEYVDFLSIGTNDLAQYTMAADRLSPDLATLTDSWQPAVLELIAMTARGRRGRAGRPASRWACAGRRRPTRCWRACSSGWGSPRCRPPPRRCPPAPCPSIPASPWTRRTRPCMRAPASRSACPRPAARRKTPKRSALRISSPSMWRDSPSGRATGNHMVPARFP